MEILQCHACGGQVPLGDGEATPCPFCGAQVAIPPAHRELRDAERREAAGRTQAAALFAKYGGKPSLLLRVFAVIFHPWFLILDGFFLLLGLVMLLFLFLGNLLGPLLHANLWDTIPDAPKGFGLFALSAGSVLGGIALGVYGRRHLMSTRSLQAALAARPPTGKGGSALCRECGAPLTVPGGADGVRCAYCHADNLVAVPADWIAGISASGARVGRAIEEAAVWLAGEHRRLKRSLFWHLTLSGGVLLAFITAVAAHGSNADWRSTWSEYVKPPRRLVRLRQLGDHSFARDQVSLSATCQESPLEIAPDECAGGSCRVWLYAALQKGERFALRLPEGAQMRVVYHSHFWWGRTFEEGFGETVTATGTSFTAQWSAWHQLRIDIPGGPGPRSVCATVQ